MNNTSSHASIFKRFVAVLIDGIFLTIFSTIAFGHSSDDLSNPQSIMYLILSVLLNWLYFAILESSSLQGTLGKKLLGIAVTDTKGNKVSFARATVRYLGKIIWILILIIGLIVSNIGETTAGENSPYVIIALLLILIGFLLLIVGYSMAIFTSEKQALHDVIAKCLIVNDKVQSGTIPWKPLIVTMVVAFIAGRVMLPFVPENSINPNVEPTPLATPTSTPTSEPTDTPTPTTNPSPIIKLPPNVLTLLQGLTIDNLKLTNLSTPKTYNVCGPLQLLSPISNNSLDLDSKLQWTGGGTIHVARLRMKEHAGRMRVITPDGNGGLKAVDQTMQQYTSAKGYVLLGFNAIDVDTQNESTEYVEDNLIIRQELDGSVSIFLCDDAGNTSSVIAERFNPVE